MYKHHIWQTRPPIKATKEASAISPDHEWGMDKWPGFSTKSCRFQSYNTCRTDLQAFVQMVSVKRCRCSSSSCTFLSNADSDITTKTLRSYYCTARLQSMIKHIQPGTLHISISSGKTWWAKTWHTQVSWSTIKSLIFCNNRKLRCFLSEGISRCKACILHKRMIQKLPGRWPSSRINF